MNINETRTFLINALVSSKKELRFFELQNPEDMQEADRDERELVIINDLALAYLTEVKLDVDTESNLFEDLKAWILVLLLEYYYKCVLCSLQADEDDYTKFFSQF